MRTRLISTSVVCCLVIVACGGDDDSAATTTTTSVAVPDEPAPTTPPPVTTPPVEAPPTTAPMVLDGATVVVANGNIVSGSAGRMTDTLGVAGFTTGAPTNATEVVEDSIVYYTTADGAQPVAESVAAKLGGVAVEPMPDPIPTETGTLDDGEVLVVLGNNQADKSLDELSGGGDTTVAATAGSTIVVANANTIGGSAGRMSATLEAGGFTVGDPANATDTIDDSIVYYSTAEGAQADAEALAEALGGVDVQPLPDPIPTETGELDGDVLLLLGSNQADKTLAELAG